MKVLKKIFGFILFAISIFLCHDSMFSNARDGVSVAEAIIVLIVLWSFTYGGWLLMTKWNVKMFRFYLFYLSFLFIAQTLLYAAHKSIDMKKVWYFDGDYTMINIAYLVMVLSIILYVVVYVNFGTGVGSVKISNWFIYAPAIICLTLFYFGARDYRYIDQKGYHYFTYFEEKHYKWSQIERIELNSTKNRSRIGGTKSYKDELELAFLIYPKNKDPYEVYMDTLDLKNLFDLNEKFLKVKPKEYFAVRPAANEYGVLAESKDWLPKKDYNTLIELLGADKKKLKKME